MSEFRICRRCFEVEGVGGGLSTWCRAGSDPHELVAAVVVDCPYLERTAMGNVSRVRRERADRECSQAHERIRESHHFGDPDRRHFMTPEDGEEWRRHIVEWEQVGGDEMGKLTENDELTLWVATERAIDGSVWPPSDARPATISEMLAAARPLVNLQAALDTFAFAVDSPAWEELSASRQVWLERAVGGVIDAAFAGSGDH